MNNPKNIRNVAFISDFNGGRRTLMQAFGVKHEKEEKNGNEYATTCFSFQYESYSFTLLQIPSSIVLSDGIMVIMDCTHGGTVHLRPPLTYALNQSIPPVLFINKMDLMLLQFKLPDEAIYQQLHNIIESVAAIHNTHQHTSTTSEPISPRCGNVAFGSSYYEWAFTLKHFAILYSGKFGISVKAMMRTLWSDRYFDPTHRKWLKKDETGTLTRGFTQFILKPIRVLHEAIVNEEKHVYLAIIASLGLHHPLHDMEQQQDILRCIMKQWFPVRDVLCDMMIHHLPSPITASATKYKQLYSGQWTDSISTDSIRNVIQMSLNGYQCGQYSFCYEILCQYLFDSKETMTFVKSKEAIGMVYCQKEAELIMYITRMIPMDNKQFIALGRVFSGTLTQGDTVRIMGPDYVHGRNTDLHITEVEQLVRITSEGNESIDQCSAGNVCGIIGIDQYLTKHSTISNADHIHPLQGLQLSECPVVHVTVEPRDNSDLPQLIKSLKFVAKCDWSVQLKTSALGPQIMSCVDPNQLDICINNVQMEFAKAQSDNKERNELKISNPFVSYRESIESVTGYDPRFPSTCVSKSPNKHNRVYMSGEPLSSAFIEAVDKGDISEQNNRINRKRFGRMLSDDYNWDSGDARRIWTFGCAPDGLANCVVNTTRGVQFLNEIKDYVVSAFMMVTNDGVLCGEPMRGIRFNLQDARLYVDAIHRGAGQYIPCSKKVFYATQIASSPKLMEPMYKMDICVLQQEQLKDVYSALSVKRGEIENIWEGVDKTYVKAFVPVSEAFGFSTLLKKNTSNDEVQVSMTFSHWKMVSGDPMDLNSRANDILMDIRKRKGMKPVLPQFSDYHDRI
eukprot:146988_1